MKFRPSFAARMCTLIAALVSAAARRKLGMVAGLSE